MTEHLNVPKVSVLMTIYNAEPYLKEAIDSIVAQTMGEWELIAIENGSSDRSRVILDSYQDVRVRAFCLPENIGRTPALRYAFEQARGEYIAVLDADDVSHPERFKKQVDYLDQRTEVGLVGTWARQINNRSEVIGKFEPPVDENELYEALGWSNPIAHSSIMYRTACAKQQGGYPANYAYAQDFALILAIAKISQIRIIGEYLCNYRVLASNMSHNPKMSLIMGQEKLALLREAEAIFSLSELVAKRNHHAQAVAQLKIGVALLRELKIISGIWRIIKAIIEQPIVLIDNGVVGKYFSVGGDTK